MEVDGDIIAICVSTIAIVISLITWRKTRPIEKKEYDSKTTMDLLQILGDQELKDKKKKVAKEYCRLLKEGNPLVFDEPIKSYVHAIVNSFNQAAVLYQHDLVNKEIFRDVVGPTVVRFWKIVKHDLSEIEQNAPTYCKHFRDVAEEFIKSGIDDEPYCPED